MIIDLHLQYQHLIQSVRFNQTVAEAGYCVSVPRGMLPAYRFISSKFPITFSVQKGEQVDCEICHKEPWCRIGEIKKPLLFPKAVTEKCRDFWADKRKGIWFRGFMPEKRLSALKKWTEKAVIEATQNGRVGLERFWDEDYLRNLGRAEFALCPDGGFKWTYRAIEACLLGATPVIQSHCEWYDGMHYCKWDGELTRTKVEENYWWAVNLITLNKETIIDQLSGKQVADMVKRHTIAP